MTTVKIVKRKHRNVTLDRLRQGDTKILKSIKSRSIRPHIQAVKCTEIEHKNLYSFSLEENISK